MNASDLVKVIGNNVAEVDFSTQISRYYDDNGIVREKIVDGLHGSFNEQMYDFKNGDTVDITISTYLIIPSNSIISNSYSQSITACGNEWDYAGNCFVNRESSNHVENRVIPEIILSCIDDVKTSCNFIEEIDIGGHSPGHVNDWNNIEYIFSSYDRNDPSFFYQLNSIIDRSIMTYNCWKDSDDKNKTSYDLYLNGIRSSGIYAAAIGYSAKSDNAVNSENAVNCSYIDFIGHRDNDFTLSAHDCMRHANAVLDGFRLNDVILNVYPVQQANRYIQVKIVSDFAYYPELSVISTLTANQTGQSAEFNAECYKYMSINLSDDIFINGFSGRSLAERQYELYDYYKDAYSNNGLLQTITINDQQCNFSTQSHITFDFNVNEAQNNSSSKNGFMSFPYGSTYSDLYDKLKHFKIDSDNDVECIGFIGIAEPPLTSTRYMNVCTSMQTLLASYLSSKLDVTDEECMINLNKYLNLFENPPKLGAIVFIPCESSPMGKMLSKKFNYSKKIDIWTTFYPVFMHKKKYLWLTFVDGADELMRNMNQSVYQPAMSYQKTNLLSSLSLNEYDTVTIDRNTDFLYEISKTCNRYVTTFFNIVTHGVKTENCESIIFHNDNDETILNKIESDNLWKLINNMSQNVICYSAACYGAGTLTSERKMHEFPFQFLRSWPKKFSRREKDKSIMYIVADVTTSPAWSISTIDGKYQSFTDRMVLNGMKKEYTYQQFIDNFNLTVKNTRKKIFEAVKKMYKQHFSEDCLLASTTINGKKHYYYRSYKKLIEQNQEIVNDFERLGRKYFITEYELNPVTSIYHKFIEEFTGKILRMGAMAYRIPVSRETLDYKICKHVTDCIKNGYKNNVDPNQIFGMLIKKIKIEEELNLNDNDENNYNFNLTQLKIIELMTGFYTVENYYKKIYSFPDFISKISDDRIFIEDDEYPFININSLLKNIILNEGIDDEQLKSSYDSIISHFLNSIFNAFKAIFIFTYELYTIGMDMFKEQIPYGFNEDDYVYNLAMVKDNLIYDWPSVGFFEVTNDFKNKKFMT